MKRVWLLVALVTGCFLKINAQTTVPFYGFELSNYEMGDTLEYDYTYNAQGGNYRHDTICWIFLDKLFTSDSTIVYTMKEIVVGEYWSMSPPHYHSHTDTIQREITDDSVCYNDNNLLLYDLNYCDSSFDEYCTFIYDTLNGAKHLKMSTLSPPGAYEAFENIGIMYYSTNTGSSTHNFELLYANLSQYGVYGTWRPIAESTAIDSTDMGDSTNVNEINLVYNASDKTLAVGDIENDQVRLFDGLGRCVLILRSNEIFNLSYFQKGVYFYSAIGIRSASGKLWIR